MNDGIWLIIQYNCNFFFFLQHKYNYKIILLSCGRIVDYINLSIWLILQLWQEQEAKLALTAFELCEISKQILLRICLTIMPFCISRKLNNWGGGFINTTNSANCFYCERVKDKVDFKKNWTQNFSSCVHPS